MAIIDKTPLEYSNHFAATIKSSERLLMLPCHRAINAVGIVVLVMQQTKTKYRSRPQAILTSISYTICA